MEIILGLAVLYSWIHGVIIVGKKVQNTTKYENVVLITGIAFLVLYILGNING